MVDPTIPSTPRPPSLRAFLDAECDLEATGVCLRHLAEAARDAKLLPARERAERAAEERSSVEHMLAEGIPDEVASYLVGTTELDHVRRRMHEVALLSLWEADLMENPDLGDRLAEALPPAIAAEHLDILDKARSPHPIEIRTPDNWWYCMSCGAAFDEGEAEAVVIGEREGWSRLEDPLTYCAICIRLASDAIDGGRS